LQSQPVTSAHDAYQTSDADGVDAALVQQLDAVEPTAAAASLSHEQSNPIILGPGPDAGYDARRHDALMQLSYQPSMTAGLPERHAPAGGAPAVPETVTPLNSPLALPGTVDFLELPPSPAEGIQQNPFAPTDGPIIGPPSQP
jgi:hypothetical protein